MRIFVRPTKAEIKVRDPITHLHLPIEGKEVQESAYWTRRLLDGDVMLGPVVVDQGKTYEPKVKK